MNQKDYFAARSVARNKLDQELGVNGTSLPEGRIAEVVNKSLEFLGITGIDTAKLIAELESSYQTLIGEERALWSDEEGWAPWLNKRKGDVDWYFWNRYQDYLRNEKAWPGLTVERLDKTTDRILGYLSDPSTRGAWDRRGMVVGHVQSGKTSNYVGLICKAADAGYKVIVVLAGFHKSLRSQTQIRLEEGFLGYDFGATLSNLDRRRVTVGVGRQDFGNNQKIANSITTREDAGDFKRSIANNFAISPGSSPLLFVVKKNGSVLRNLLGWAIGVLAQDRDEAGRPYIKNLPLLVIDDEADQGSIDTRANAVDEYGNPDPDHDPTTLNKRIRQLLYIFDQSAYVGYTATPFANILIHDQEQTNEDGEGLFPRSFIVSLPTASNYVGPSLMFGLSKAEGDDVEALPILREVSDHADSLDINEESGWIPPKHNKAWVPRCNGIAMVPESLREAIRAFVIACAVRAIRGDETAHNTMLIHVTRFTAVQNKVAEQVEAELTDIGRRLRLGDGGSQNPVLDEFFSLWEQDFLPTSEKLNDLRLATDCARVSWEQLEKQLWTAAVSIQVREINGSAGDVLDYLQHDSGLNVIAVGGDKLSRGLTLEGLSVSYFLRASRMYDTLMQMGRWFGYRPRFLDLCRLYSTSEMMEWFGHIAAASEELREDFDRMAASGGTPRNFGHRVQCHPLMLVTSAVKMRHGTTINLSFQGDISETINFWRTRTELSRNWHAAVALIETVERARVVASQGTARSLGSGSWVWQNVDSAAILDFLGEYREHHASIRVKTRLLEDYVRMENSKGRLTRWTIFLASGYSTHQGTLGCADFKMVGRAWHVSEEDKKSLQDDNHYRIGRLLSPADEAADLDRDEWNEALGLAQREWDENPDPETSKGKRPTKPSGRAIRQIRGSDRGLLLLYPLDPHDKPGTHINKHGKDVTYLYTDKVDSDARINPVLGFGISFPYVDPYKASTVQYKVNNVYWRQEFGDPVDYDDEE
ncbi:MAG: Z1 domain-containing protein [Prochlorococcaceae cyanobacterium]